MKQPLAFAPAPPPPPGTPLPRPLIPVRDGLERECEAAATSVRVELAQRIRVVVRLHLARPSFSRELFVYYSLSRARSLSLCLSHTHKL
jgi:hypothetical protein